MALDPEAPNCLHSISRHAHWSRANEKGVFPGVSSVLNWSVWGEIGERGTRRAAFELGLFRESELEPPASVDGWMWSIFYGRPTANVDSWRSLYERGLTAAGTGSRAEREVFGETRAEGGSGTDALGVPADDTERDAAAPLATPDRRHEIAAKRPRALALAADGLRRIRDEAQQWWRAATIASPPSDAAQARALVADAVDWFERADPLHILVSLFATEAVTELATAAERAGRPAAANALMIGYPGMEEFRTTVGVWDLSRGSTTLEHFLAEHGFHGSQEGEIASRSWRESAEPILALAERYRGLDAAADPRRREAEATASREGLEAELRAALPSDERAALDDSFARAALFLPLREAGRATLTIALDAMRAGARTLGAIYSDDGVLADPDDVFLLTRAELLELPPSAPALVEERRALRRGYMEFEIPESWQGMPEKLPRATNRARRHATPASAGPHDERATTLEGLGASAGIYEGKACVVRDARELDQDFDPGDILVAPATDPSWAPLFLIAGAVVIDTGSNISHAAVVAREMGIPGVVRVAGASERLRTGQRLRVDGNAGTVEVLD